LWVGIDITPGGLSCKGNVLDCSSLSKAQILGAFREFSPLVPRPVVFLRFSGDALESARKLSSEIEETGQCDDGSCLFHREDRRYPDAPMKSVHGAGCKV